MNQKTLKVLEYTKIIMQLQELADCPIGKEKCRALVPHTDIGEIRNAQEETSAALTRILRKGNPSFSGVVNIQDSLKRLDIGSSLSIPELLRIQNLLSASAKAKSYNRRDTELLQEDCLDPYFSQIEPLTPLYQEISRCILSEDEVSDDASPGLRRVRNAIRTTNDKVHSQLNSILNSSREYLQDAVITMRNGRYCLPVKAEHKGRFQGMIHDQSSSGSTFFIEPVQIVRLNNELRELEIAEAKEIEAVLANLSNLAAEQVIYLETNLDVLGRLDFIFAKGRLSRSHKGSEPIFNTRGYINLKEARHPLLDPHKVVPIDVNLGKDFYLLIITGPNTGGKTVSLKTVGLLTLMGQAGLHIPAFQASELAVFQDVFADIGDEQSIEQSLSTFSSHMVNIVSILENCTPDSLVLFDELGAGTDPTEGAALAIAILTFLLNMQVRTMATTHYSEMKVFAMQTPGVENASCEFDVETLRPTYRLLIGIPGRSNAFAISHKLGLPDYIIDEARRHINEEELSLEDMLNKLEENRKAIEQERTEAERYRAEVARLKERLSVDHEKELKRRDRLLREANEEARRILLQAKETADKTIRNITKLSNDAGLTRQLETERGNLRDGLQKANERLVQPKRTVQNKPADFKIGDAVHIVSMNVNGTVNTLPDSKGRLYVQMGILRSQIHISDLELIKEETINVSRADSKNRQSHQSQIKISKGMTISPEINVIGHTVDEALPIVEKYLDDAYLAHLPQVRIIHGRGTGALKNSIHQMLRRVKYVESYRLGSFGEGDTGVTIVNFNPGKTSGGK